MAVPSRGHCRYTGRQSHFKKVLEPKEALSRKEGEEITAKFST